MCGIAGVFLRDESFEVNLEGMLDTMLDSIEHRGGDATGFVSLDSEGVSEWQKAACGARDFSLNRREIPKGSTSFISHTRWATQGLPAFMENNHPLKRGDFFIIHNGHVSNDRDLFDLSGRKRYGQVDSEALAARLASLGSLDNVGAMMAEVYGAAAIAAVDQREPDRLVLARGSYSPLFVLATKRIVLFASTKSTIERAYTQYVGRLPKKTKVESVPEGTVLSFKRGSKIRRTSFKVKQPKPVVKTVSSPAAWKDSSTEAEKVEAIASTWSAWKDDDVDMLDCDGCQEKFSWKQVEYRTEEGYTLMFCPECAIDFDDGVTPTAKAVVVYDDYEAANELLLRTEEEDNTVEAFLARYPNSTLVEGDER